MSYDPYAYGADVPPPPADSSAARSRVTPAAIFLIIVGVLNLFMAAGPAFYGVGASKVTPEELERQMQLSNPQALADAKAQGWTIADIRNWLIYGSFSWAGVDFLASFLVILGGIRMLYLKNYGLAVLASIVAALPIVSCSGCCGLGTIAGVWSIIVLVNADVRATFQ